MTRISDLHWNLVDARAPRVASVTLGALQRGGHEYVLGGGWAVFAQVPAAPSVDCDVYVPGDLPGDVRTELAKHGIEVGPQRQVETLGLDSVQELLGTGDTDLGIPFAGYVPRKLFAGRLQQRDLRVDPPISNVVVPDRESLALVKLAALRDRSLAYRALEDGATMALLDPSRANLIRALSQGYFLRKAGKDLFDMSVLVPEKRQIAECLALADRHGILDAIRRWLGKVPAPILDFASDAAARTEQSDPAAWLRRVAEATP